MREQVATYPVTVPRGGKEEHEFEYAKRFNPYVYSTNRNAALIHRVLRVQIRWWDHQFSCMVRRQHPNLIAECACGQFFRIDGAKAKTCAIPRPDAVMCGKCEGNGVNFPRRGGAKVPKELAKVRLGCVETAL